MPDQYKTIEGESTGEFRDRGSKFIAYAFPVFTEQEWQDCLARVRKEHPKARHHCFAFRLGLDGNQYRANDDGEPSGTAGRPILGQIDSFGLTNIIVIVVRYFGGTLLGTSGLIHAYKTSAADALTNATIIEKQVEEVYRIEFDYALMSQVMNAIKKLGLEILEQEFSERAWVSVAIRQSLVGDTLLRLKAYILDIRLEEAEGVEQVKGVDILHQYMR